MSEIVDVLLQCQLFIDVDRGYLEEKAQDMSIKTYAEGDTVYKGGDHMQGIYVICSGAVRFDLDFIEAFSPMVTILKQSSFFGEHDLFDNTPSLSTATCQEYTRLVFIEKPLFLEMFHSQPPIAQTMAKVLANNCRMMILAHAIDLTQGAEARLAKLFLHLHHIEKIPYNPGDVFVIRYSHNELADMIGLTRTAISKPLKTWKDEGWIEIKNKEIRVLNLEALFQYLTIR